VVDAPSVRKQLHQPRLAEMVAEVLRERIVTGQLRDGDSLQRQEDLLAEFAVSRPSLREALRILESEGLITVRRGNRGGATVHAPQAQNAGNTIGLVLKAQHVPLADLGAALGRLEPLCASLCASRVDRAEEVLPRLRAAHEATVEALDSELDFTRLARRFHEVLVDSCGNETLKLLVGALESLWSKQEVAWARRATDAGGFPGREQRQEGMQAHSKLIELIDQGDEAAVAIIARKHLDATQRFALSEREGARPLS
jgi:GntR family transcriptional regulator, transcriptional repressor for pyruvate dehydrogenase complex